NRTLTVVERPLRIGGQHRGEGGDSSIGVGLISGSLSLRCRVVRLDIGTLLGTLVQRRPVTVSRIRFGALPDLRSRLITIRPLGSRRSLRPRLITIRPLGSRRSLRPRLITIRPLGSRRRLVVHVVLRCRLDFERCPLSDKLRTELEAVTGCISIV